MNEQILQPEEWVLEKGEQQFREAKQKKQWT